MSARCFSLKATVDTVKSCLSFSIVSLGVMSLVWALRSGGMQVLFLCLGCCFCWFVLALLYILLFCSFFGCFFFLFLSLLYLGFWLVCLFSPLLFFFFFCFVGLCLSFSFSSFLNFFIFFFFFVFFFFFFFFFFSQVNAYDFSFILKLKQGNDSLN